MTVTVCIPVWNGEAFVKETLESVRSQTMSDITVLISVDKSDDRSVNICRTFAAEDSRFQVFCQSSSLGMVGNVNWLLRQVNSEFANILPHDDVIAPTYLERLAAELKKHPEAVLVYCDLQTFGKRETVRVGPEAKGDLFTRILNFLYQDTDATAWRGVFRSKVLENGCYHEEINGAAADQAWLLRLVIKGHLVRLPEILYRKRLHDDSIVAKIPRTEDVLADSRWVDHCVSCHRIALAANQWTHAQSQAIAVASMMRAMRLKNLARLGLTSSETITAMLACMADYTLRLSGLAPAGSDIMKPVDIPDRLRTYFELRTGPLISGENTETGPAQLLATDRNSGLRQTCKKLARMLKRRALQG